MDLLKQKLGSIFIKHDPIIWFIYKIYLLACVYTLWGYVGFMKVKPHSTTHEETLKRRGRIAGQVQGVRRMIEEKEYCIDIITQIQAARSALRAVELQILKKHMEHCVSDAFASGSQKESDAKMEELLKVMRNQY